MRVQFSKEESSDLNAEGSSSYDLSRKLVGLAVENSSGGGVTSFFSHTSASAGVLEVMKASSTQFFTSGEMRIKEDNRELCAALKINVTWECCCASVLIFNVLSTVQTFDLIA